MKRPSAAQRRIIGLMREGWAMGLYGGLKPNIRIQQGGLGRGGPAEDIHPNTFDAMVDKGYIHAPDRNWQRTEYFLTEEVMNDG